MIEKREKEVVEYFQLGYSQKEILYNLWLNDGIKISERHLRRILADLGLYRRKPSHSFSEIYDLIKNEIDSSGCLLGYRNMHQKLSVIHKVQISRTNVAKIQNSIDPEGVQLRKLHRLKRRKYIAKGPNYLWHIDGYDKLKRYGFCIHGCIDGYSRKILWLEVSSTNNCPQTIASYFVKLVRSINGSAVTIRGDRGTENYNIAGLQMFLTNRHESFLFGRSTSNQRIEAWWSQLRKSCAQWWMNYFKDMLDERSFDETDSIHRECIKFCFMGILQKELDEVKKIHNTHRIRPFPNQECPNGKPEIIYGLPEIYGTIDFKVKASADFERLALTYTKEKSFFGCNQDFEELALRLMIQHNLYHPSTVKECRDLYDKLIQYISVL